MIRFIDLRHHEEDIGERFAFWDTVTDQFLTDLRGQMAWGTADDLRAGWTGARSGPFERAMLARLLPLLPDWAHHVEAAEATHA